MSKIIGLIIIGIVLFLITIIAPMVAGATFKEVLIINVLNYLLVGIVYIGAWLVAYG